MKHDDEQLARRCVEGDIDAFSDLVARYEKRIFNIAYRMVVSREDARDVAQTVFMNAYASLHTFNPQLKFSSWIYRIAVNESINLSQKRRPEDPVADELYSTAPDPAQQAGSAELLRLLQKVLTTLATDYRVVIVLKHFQGHSYREISEILGIQEKTVKSRLFTARNLLRDALVTQGVLES